MNSLETAITLRLAKGQQFNAYERADEEGWRIGIGPVTSFFGFAESVTEEGANLIVEALRRSLPAPATPTQEPDHG